MHAAAGAPNADPAVHEALAGHVPDVFGDLVGRARRFVERGEDLIGECDGAGARSSRHSSSSRSIGAARPVHGATACAAGAGTFPGFPACGGTGSAGCAGSRGAGRTGSARRRGRAGSRARCGRGDGCGAARPRRSLVAPARAVVGVPPVGVVVAPAAVVVVAAAAQPERVIVLVSSVTAPVAASKRPWIVAPVVAVIDVQGQHASDQVRAGAERCRAARPARTRCTRSAADDDDAAGRRGDECATRPGR